MILLLRDLREELRKEYIYTWEREVKLSNQVGIPNKKAERFLEAVKNGVGKLMKEVKL